MGKIDDALEKLAKKDIIDDALAMKDIFDAVKMIKDDKGKCISDVDKYEIAKMESILESWSNPISFISHVGSDLIINGKDVLGHFENAKMYKSMGEYENMGKEIGDALALVLVGKLEISLKNAIQNGIAEEMTLKNLRDTKTAALIVEGILVGAVKAEGLEHIEDCVKDGDKIILDTYHAVQDFEKKDPADIAKGLALMGEVVKEIPAAVKECGLVSVDLAKLTKMAAAFTNPASFVIHVGKDLIINGVTIYREIKDSTVQWHNGEYEKFGEDVGMALAKIILGQEETAENNLFLH